MPDTPARWPAELLSSKRLTEIERRHPVRAGGRPPADYGEVEELLAHIDALTAAVIDFAGYQYGAAARREFAAVLRGEQPNTSRKPQLGPALHPDGYPVDEMGG